jgi:hypothetical protein|tara:strand:+ start:309 stop:812 length:504 start_codon:yes stop_codon:yes gene_type:complete
MNKKEKENWLRHLRMASRHCTQKIKEFTEARKLIQVGIKKVKCNIPLKPPEDGMVSVEELAELIGKGNLGYEGRLKAVKRATIGIKPAGNAPDDYKEIHATKTHVRDYTADWVGQIIYLFTIRTRFRVEDVRHLFLRSDANLNKLMKTKKRKRRGLRRNGDGTYSFR